MKEKTRRILYFSTYALIGIGCVFVGYFFKNTANVVPKPEKPVVSVLLPTYNREDVVRTAIESILNQSFTNFEFIIVDDGSTDSTSDIIKEYAKKDKRIVYVKNEKNSGIVTSLNRGLDIARGKYIARMDDDDASHRGRLERQVQAMEEHPEIAILGTQIGANLNDEIKKTSPKVDDANAIEINTYFSSALAHPTIMIRLDFLTKNNIRYSEKYKYAEDCSLYRDVLNAGGLINRLKEPLLAFHVKRTKRGANYGRVQQDSFTRLQQEKFALLNITPSDFLLGSSRSNKNRCFLLRQMFDANQDKNIVDQTVLKKMIHERCPQPPENAIMVFHPKWNDLIVRNGHRINRLVNNDGATIIGETSDTITLKWDKWDTEIYTKKNPTSFIYKQNASDTKK